MDNKDDKTISAHELRKLIRWFNAERPRESRAPLDDQLVRHLKDLLKNGMTHIDEAVYGDDNY